MEVILNHALKSPIESSLLHPPTLRAMHRPFRITLD